MMNMTLTVLTVGLMLGLAGLVMADGPTTVKAKPTSGPFLRLDGTSVVISSGKGDQAKEVAIKTDGNTVVMVNGNPVKVTDLTKDQRLVITLDDSGVATKIDVTDAAPAKVKPAA